MAVYEDRDSGELRLDQNTRKVGWHQPSLSKGTVPRVTMAGHGTQTAPCERMHQDVEIPSSLREQAREAGMMRVMKAQNLRQAPRDTRPVEINLPLQDSVNR